MQTDMCQPLLQGFSLGNGRGGAFHFLREKPWGQGWKYLTFFFLIMNISFSVSLPSSKTLIPLPYYQTEVRSGNVALRAGPGRIPIVREGWGLIHPPLSIIVLYTDETRFFANGFFSFGIVQNHSAIEALRTI